MSEERQRVREEQSRLVLNAYRAWPHKQRARTMIGQAITYTWTIEGNLTIFLKATSGAKKQPQ